MKWIKLYEDFKDSELEKTSWQVTKGDKTIKITLQEVLDVLDDGYQIDPKELEHLLIKTKRDPKRVSRADLSYPIILLKKAGKIISILDGQHRVVKALESGDEIRCRVLDLDVSDEKFKSVFDII
jgi:hypothetical protein